MENAMAKIRIISTPPGQAPEEIREDWVEIEIPLPTKLSDEDLHSIGVLGGEPDQKDDAYFVETNVAITALAEANRAAVYWWIEWRNHTSVGRSSKFLGFSKSVCELVE